MLSAFHLFIDENLLRIILKCTNKRLSILKKRKFDYDELLAAIGFIIRAGSDKDNISCITTFFTHNDSKPFYRCCLPKNRIELFLSHVTFDNKIDRVERQKTDKMAAIRDIWEMFQYNLLMWYIPGINLTVDEQLYGYRGYSPGRSYMPAKPVKYGIKIFWINDSTNGYALKGILYTGKNSDGTSEKGLTKTIVTTLSKPFYQTNRNIVMDRFFTSHDLLKCLLDNGLTALGTVSSNRRDVPDVMKNIKNRALYSCDALFEENNIMMISYIPKRNKNVLLMSSCHSSNEIYHQRDDKLPQVIHEYNQEKGGTDLMDSCIEDYSVKRKTNRYPLVLFFNMIDIAIHNSYIIYCESNTSEKKCTKRKFMKTVALQLSEKHIKKRMNNPKVYGKIKSSLDLLGFTKKETSNFSTSLSSAPKKCQFKGCRRSTRVKCDSCSLIICSEHKFSKVFCTNCKYYLK